MIVSGDRNSNQADVEQVATETIRCLLNTVPSAVPGIAFLSGGQSKERSYLASQLHECQLKI